MLPPPAYPTQSTASVRRRGPASIDALSLDILHYILTLTLDPLATRGRFDGDLEEEKVRRLWGLFRGLRGVNRRFCLVSSSILRSTFLHVYLSLLENDSSEPYPSVHTTQLESVDGTGPVFASRTREETLFDKFIAIRLGTSLRQVESSLSEASESEVDLFHRQQPIARAEDLLLTLPRALIDSVKPAYPPARQLPLPHSHLTVALTPSKATLYLCSSAVDTPTSRNIRQSREAVVRVPRLHTLEGTVSRIGQALEDMRRGLVEWGGDVL